MLTEIGILVTIVKNLGDIAKTGGDLFGGKKKAEETASAVIDLKGRISGIAEQLHESVVLSKMLPIWKKDYEKFDIFKNNLSDDDVRMLDAKLRELIDDSIHDHFSGTFFRTSFADLQEVDKAISGFRERLTDLEKQLKGIAPGNAEAWRYSWPTLKVRLQDLRQKADTVYDLADDAHSALIKELREAGGERR